MKARLTHEKGILAKLLEQSIRILLIKECKKISNIRIDIISSTNKIIKGEIQKINIIANDIDYKDLIFDELELEAHSLKINLKIKKRELYFKNDPIIKFKISLSQNSLKSVLLYRSNWLMNMISNEILNQAKLEDIKIKNDQLLIKASEENNNLIENSQIEITAAKGKIYLNNIINNKTIQIPIEEKINIENVNIENNLINIIGNSSISF